jgi:hypothetical protein
VHSISQLQGQRGFRKGGSILTDIEQILDTGTTEKLEEYVFSLSLSLFPSRTHNTNLFSHSLTPTHRYLREPRNIASIALQKIHGVGPSIAKNLMDVGILNIADAREQVRLSAARKTPKYVFEARQLVGIKHYEAFQERIPREEVGRLAAYVRVCPCASLSLSLSHTQQANILLLPPTTATITTTGPGNGSKASARCASFASRQLQTWQAELG